MSESSTADRESLLTWLECKVSSAQVEAELERKRLLRDARRLVESAVSAGLLRRPPEPDEG